MSKEFLEESELFEEVDLCDKNGEIIKKSIGWSRKPIIKCDLSNTHNFRRKRWNYWTINNDRYFFTAAVSHMDYAAIIFIYMLDIDKKVLIERQKEIPLGKKVYMKDNVEENVFYKSKNLDIKFLNKDDSVYLDIFWKDFYNRENLKSIFSIYGFKDIESLNVVIPWNNKQFQFTSKQICLNAEGYVAIGDMKYDFLKENSYATLDFGRGVWPRNIIWNWATFSGKVNDELLGINLGAKWTYNTGMSENAIYYSNKIIKIHEDVEFIYDNANLYNDWIIKTKYTDNIYLKFSPIFNRESNKNKIFVKSKFKQLFGYFNGTIKLNDNESLNIVSILGCSEEHIAKW